jgi:hypothetical protein
MIVTLWGMVTAEPPQSPLWTSPMKASVSTDSKRSWKDAAPRAL